MFPKPRAECPRCHRFYNVTNNGYGHIRVHKCLEGNTVEEDTVQAIIELAGDLDRNELRAVIWELLLMSDGPDKIDGDVNSKVHVECLHEGEGPSLFHVTSEEW